MGPIKAALGAAGGAAARPRFCRTRGMDLLLRPGRQSGQVLSELRSAETRTETCRRMEMRLRRDGDRKVLPGVRKTQARRQRRLDLLLRRGEQRQVLPGVRREEARRRAPVQM